MSETPPRRIRRAARVLLVDGEGRLLLFRYVPDDLPPFWLLPGGECEPDEGFPAAASRELLEETGIAAKPRCIAVRREFDYIYEGMPVRGIEHFFHHQTQEVRIDTTGHTEVEQRAMQEYRWFAPAELSGWHEPVYPADLAELIGQVVIPDG